MEPRFEFFGAFALNLSVKLPLATSSKALSGKCWGEECQSNFANVRLSSADLGPT